MPKPAFNRAKNASLGQARPLHVARGKEHYFEGSRRYVEPKTGLTVVNVHAGDCFVTDKDDDIAATILGSCISACIRDPEIGVGGMNHFLLPATNAHEADSARFGAFAMEQLINEILKRGGRRERLEVKLFGGGNVIKSSAAIGTKNAAFAKQYVLNEGMQLASADVGGTWPRKVRYAPVSGKAMIMKLRRDSDYKNVAAEEEKYTKQVVQTTSTPDDDIELF